MLIQTKRFSPRASGDFAGTSPLTCSESRSGKQQPVARLGPGWWSETEAEDKLDHSKWVFDNGLNGGVFSCVGQGASRANGPDLLFRRFECTYTYAGPNSDKNGRVVFVTTGRDNFTVPSNTPG